MQIFGTILSPFVARVVLAARYKGLTYALTMPTDGIKTPAYLKLNPMGRMPTINDGGFILYESGVILDYLDTKYKKKPIIPRAAKAVAHARLIGAICGEYLQPACFELHKQRDPAARDQKTVDEKLQVLNQAVDVLEKLVAAKPYALGGAFSLADCYLAPALFIADVVMPQVGLDNPAAKRRKLARYFAKAQSNKYLKATLADMYGALREFHERAAA